MADLNDAIVLACEYHRSEKSKDGEQYVLHPIRVKHNSTSRADLDAAVSP
jgi:(p)ppGpp synthase/HD superfamily hydrolase